MTLDLGLALRSGVTWGIVGVVLLILAAIVGPFISFYTVEGVTIATFAVMFAGVNFAYVNSGRQAVESFFGGALAGLVAGIILFIIVSFVLPLLPFVSAAGAGTGLNVSVLINSLFAGIAGAVGMLVIKRT